MATASGDKDPGGLEEVRSDGGGRTCGEKWTKASPPSLTGGGDATEGKRGPGPAAGIRKGRTCPTMNGRVQIAVALVLGGGRFQGATAL
jgi:hypothetical protein